MEREAQRPKRPVRSEAEVVASPVRSVASVATESCTSCGAETPPDDQFFGDEGVLCPACHLAHDAVNPDDPGWITGVGRMLAGAALPTVIVWFSLGLTLAWAEGTLLIQTAIATMLVLGGVLGAAALASLIGAAAQLRQVTIAPAASAESMRTRSLRGIGASWSLLCAVASLLMLAYTFVSMF